MSELERMDQLRAAANASDFDSNNLIQRRVNALSAMKLSALEGNSAAYQRYAEIKDLLIFYEACASLSNDTANKIEVQQELAVNEEKFFRLINEIYSSGKNFS